MLSCEMRLREAPLFIRSGHGLRVQPRESLRDHYNEVPSNLQYANPGGVQTRNSAKTRKPPSCRNICRFRTEK